MRIPIILAAIFLTFVATLSASAELVRWPAGSPWPAGVPSIKLGEDYYYVQPNDGKTAGNMTVQQCEAYYAKMRADFRAALANVCGPGREPYDQVTVNRLTDSNAALANFEEGLCKQIAKRIAVRRKSKGKSVSAATLQKTGHSFSQPALSGPGLLDSDQGFSRQTPGARGTPSAPVAVPFSRSR
jgi:hypothetical protein